MEAQSIVSEGQENRLGEALVQIESVTIHERFDQTTAVICYQFTNKGEATASFDGFTLTTAFQNGISLEKDYSFEGDYPFENRSKNLQTEATIKVYEAYILSDAKQSISVEVREFISFDDAVVKREFPPEEFQYFENVKVGIFKMADQGEGLLEEYTPVIDLYEDGSFTFLCNYFEGMESLVGEWSLNRESSEYVFVVRSANPFGVEGLVFYLECGGDSPYARFYSDYGYESTFGVTDNTSAFEINVWGESALL